MVGDLISFIGILYFTFIDWQNLDRYLDEMKEVKFDRFTRQIFLDYPTLDRRIREIKVK